MAQSSGGSSKKLFDKLQLGEGTDRKNLVSDESSSDNYLTDLQQQLKLVAAQYKTYEALQSEAKVNQAFFSIEFKLDTDRLQETVNIFSKIQERFITHGDELESTEKKEYIGFVTSATAILTDFNDLDLNNLRAEKVNAFNQKVSEFQDKYFREDLMVGTTLSSSLQRSRERVDEGNKQEYNATYLARKSKSKLFGVIGVACLCVGAGILVCVTPSAQAVAVAGMAAVGLGSAAASAILVAAAPTLLIAGAGFLAVSAGMSMANVLLKAKPKITPSPLELGDPGITTGKNPKQN